MKTDSTSSEGSVQVEPDHYADLSYDHKGRFINYWHQINETLQTGPANVLEIGVGNGFVSNYLKGSGLPLTSLDFDERLKPDVVGSVLELPFEDGAFDVVTCFEVLEHLPFEQFPVALKEIHRVAKRMAIISLPDTTRHLKFSFYAPKIGVQKRLVNIPLFPPTHKFDGQHYWEVGAKGFSVATVGNTMEQNGFKLLKTYRIFESPYHRFFVLKK